jgi:predicted lactoylglutathione lyase
VTLGTNKFDQALVFYTALMAEFNETLLWQTKTMAAWGPSREAPALCITVPFDQLAASSGNGVMVALKVSTKEQVDRAHATAISLGASCDGKPGPRGTGGFYGGYFRDLDGNKLNVYTPASAL